MIPDHTDTERIVGPRLHCEEDPVGFVLFFSPDHMREPRVVCADCYAEQDEPDDADVFPVYRWRLLAGRACDRCQKILKSAGEDDDPVPFHDAWPERPQDAALDEFGRFRNNER